MLCREGAIAVKIDYASPRHQQLAMPNAYVIMTLKGLHSKGWVRRIFSWGWAHYVLTACGIEGHREKLHLPAETQPNTFKLAAVSEIPAAFKEQRGGFSSRGGRFGGRGGARQGQDRDFADRRPRAEGEDRRPRQTKA